MLTPLLNAFVDFLIFGILLGAKNGVQNNTAFLMAGFCLELRLRYEHDFSCHASR